jgi:FG-GAP-like repeat
VRGEPRGSRRPNIADFDGDGFPDVGVAGGNRYVVAQWTAAGGMAQLWDAVTLDGSSQRTGSSVFDFDGDGRSEVIYGDELFLRIYPGVEPDCAIGGPGCDGDMTDAEILFIDINSSRTRSEYPIIADVDGDFKAELVFSTNNESAQGSTGDAGDGMGAFNECIEDNNTTGPLEVCQPIG